jgi:hypothetical protein
MRLALVALAALAFAGAAAADPPALVSATSVERQPAVTFAAQRAIYVTIEIAADPTRGADGGFVAPLVQTDLTDAQIAAGRWADQDTLAPGTYWVLLHATADFDSCWQIGEGWDATCPDGWSQPLQLVVAPSVPFVTRARASAPQLAWRPLARRFTLR